METFCITGATGFIGSHLLAVLEKRPGVALRILARAAHGGARETIRNGQLIVGDLLDAESLSRFVVPGATVIHLAQVHDAPMDTQIQITRTLAQACLKAGVRRFLYISTATVVGRTPTTVVTEETPCDPGNDYERQKLMIEGLLLKTLSPHIDIAVLRPTAVFGTGGKNLQKLVYQLRNDSDSVQHLRRMLYGRRSMNLVAVENVVAAIEFLISIDRPLAGEVFLVSDDDAPINNYQDVDQILRTGLLMKTANGGVALPSFVLKLLLILVGRSQTDPQIKYSDCKLRDWGFEPVTRLEPALMRFAQACKKRTAHESVGSAS
nr:NAD(P)-dependent oxidoreductase [Burkholderia sp. L27(2015)]